MKKVANLCFNRFIRWLRRVLVLCMAQSKKGSTAGPLEAQAMWPIRDNSAGGIWGGYGTGLKGYVQPSAICTGRYSGQTARILKSYLCKRHYHYLMHSYGSNKDWEPDHGIAMTLWPELFAITLGVFISTKLVKRTAALHCAMEMEHPAMGLRGSRWCKVPASKMIQQSQGPRYSSPSTLASWRWWCRSLQPIKKGGMASGSQVNWENTVWTTITLQLCSGNLSKIVVKENCPACITTHSVLGGSICMEQGVAWSIVFMDSWAVW